MGMQFMKRIWNSSQDDLSWSRHIHIYVSKLVKHVFYLKFLKCFPWVSGKENTIFSLVFHWAPGPKLCCWNTWILHNTGSLLNVKEEVDSTHLPLITTETQVLIWMPRTHHNVSLKIEIIMGFFTINICNLKFLNEGLTVIFVFLFCVNKSYTCISSISTTTSFIYKNFIWLLFITLLI